jgi:Antitoxin VbhA
VRAGDHLDASGSRAGSRTIRNRLAAEKAAASVRADGLEPSPAMIERSGRWVHGEIDADQMYQETLDQYRRP